jgi:hypothetical protein
VSESGFSGFEDFQDCEEVFSGSEGDPIWDKYCLLTR